MAARMLEYDENGNVFDPQAPKPEGEQQEETKDSKATEQPSQEKKDSVEDYFSEEQQTNDGNDEIPEKYRGKTQAELIKMLEDSQKFAGKQSNEIGDLRSVINDFVASNSIDNSQSATQAPQESEDEYDYFTEPDKAIDRRIDNHPSVRAARELTAKQAQQAAQSMLKEKHPDYAEVTASPAFVEWVKASRIRQQLAYEADQNYNFDAADELLTNFKERNAVANQQLQTAQQNRKQNVRAASTGNARGSAEPRGQKKIRASDIRRLKREKPEVYNDRSQEILLAYAQGRVIRD